MMQKLITAIFLTVLPIFGFAVESVAYDFQVTRVLDGDTVAFAAPFLPTPLKQELSIRVYGVDTPERGFRAKCPEEDKRGKEATAYTKYVIANAKKVQVVIMDWDKYGGRVLGDILVDGLSLRYLLIANGYAREYFGKAKLSWCIKK
jgi:endonuclease YncB( thermonuclease family)